MLIFWVPALCGFVVRYRRFSGTYRLYLQIWKWRLAFLHCLEATYQRIALRDEMTNGLRASWLSERPVMMNRFWIFCVVQIVVWSGLLCIKYGFTFRPLVRDLVTRTAFTTHLTLQDIFNSSRLRFCDVRVLSKMITMIMIMIIMAVRKEEIT